MDELERDLRRVLRDDRLRVEPDADALAQVHRGAERRRRRRRAAVGGVSGLSVVAVAVLAVATPVLNQQRQDETAAGASSAQPERAERSPDPTASPLQTARRASPKPHEKDQKGGPVPQGFAAASVTAVSPSSFWVLGTAPCDNPTCTSIVRTSDGGKTFRGLPAPEAPLAEGKRTNRTVSDLRFAGTDDGFAFGGALWSTHDGGSTWSVQDVPGRVVRLEADRGSAWAVVEKDDEYRLYRSATSSDSWRRVALPVPLDTVAPDLALQSGTVTLTGTSGQRAVSVVSTDGDSFDVSDRPCAGELDSQLSAFGDTLWMFCATGTQGRPYVSSDGGRSWRAVDAAPPGGWANSTAVGARGADSAVLASGGRVYTVSTGGRVDRTRSVGGGAAFDYVGFTTSEVGYAVLTDPAPSSLLRTTDGGGSWSVVRYS